MQRSISYQNIIIQLILVGLFAVYLSMTSIHLLLPPMLGILFYRYYKSLKRHDLFGLIIIIAMLFIVEAEKGFWFGSSIIYFSLLSMYVMPKVIITVRCKNCIKAMMVFAAYFGYWLFVWLTDQILIFVPPQLDWYVFFYGIVEFLILSVMS